MKCGGCEERAPSGDSVAPSCTHHVLLTSRMVRALSRSVCTCFYQRDACRDLDGRDILHNRVRVEIRSPCGTCLLSGHAMSSCDLQGGADPVLWTARHGACIRSSRQAVVRLACACKPRAQDMQARARRGSAACLRPLSAEAKHHSLLTSWCMIAPMPGGVAAAAEAGAAATVAAGKF